MYINTHIYSGTFSTIFLKVLMFLIHQPTPTARSSDHCGSPLCIAGIMFSSSSSASEWNAHAKWHVERPAIEADSWIRIVNNRDSERSNIPHNCHTKRFVYSSHSSSTMSRVLYLGGAAACGRVGAKRWAGRYEDAWRAGTLVHTHQEPRHLHKYQQLISFFSPTDHSTRGQRPLNSSITWVHVILSHNRSPVLERSYPLLT